MALIKGEGMRAEDDDETYFGIICAVVTVAIIVILWCL